MDHYRYDFVRPAETSHLPEADRPCFACDSQLSDGQWLFKRFLDRYKQLGGDPSIVNREPVDEPEPVEPEPVATQPAAPAVKAERPNPVDLCNVAPNPSVDSDGRFILYRESTALPVGLIKEKTGLTTGDAWLVLTLLQCLSECWPQPLKCNIRHLGLELGLAVSTVNSAIEKAYRRELIDYSFESDHWIECSFGPWITSRQFVDDLKDRKARVDEAWTTNSKYAKPQSRKLTPQPVDTTATTTAYFHPHPGFAALPPDSSFQVGNFVVPAAVRAATGECVTKPTYIPLERINASTVDFPPSVRNAFNGADPWDGVRVVVGCDRHTGAVVTVGKDMTQQYSRDPLVRRVIFTTNTTESIASLLKHSPLAPLLAQLHLTPIATG